MGKYRKLTHVYYKCDYHIVFTPKYRFRILEGMVKSLLKQKPYWGNHFWSRGYFVSTVGLDEAMIKRYVKYQEHH